MDFTYEQKRAFVETLLTNKEVDFHNLDAFAKADTVGMKYFVRTVLKHQIQEGSLVQHKTGGETLCVEKIHPDGNVRAAFWNKISNELVIVNTNISALNLVTIKK